MFDIDFDQIEEDLNKAEEYLSFAPTPKTGTLRQSSNNGNIFFYDKEFENDHQGTNKFSESMADTIIFTAPVDPAIRSVDYSNSEPYYKHAPTATHNGPETHSGDYDDDEEDSLPRNDIPVAYPTSKADPYRSNQQSSMPTKPKARPISLERIQELHQSRVVRQQNLLKERRAMDELALAECTFKPQISKGTRVILNQKAQFEQLDQDCRTMTGDHNSALNARAQEISEVEVSDRLYKEAAVRSAQHRWVQQEVEKARQMQYTFQPMLNPRNSSGPSHGHPEDRRPIHERIADMQKEKRQYLQALKASVEQAQGDLTFQPKIDARSRKIAEQKLLGYGGNPNLSPGRASTTTQPPSSGSSSSAAVPPQPPRGLGRPQLHSGGNSNAPGAVMSGEAQAALVLGFHTDVGSRLMDQGKQAAQRKQQLLHARENELAEAMQPATLCPGSERLVQRKAGLQG